jgi:PadR family transcriptional regulator AphA
VSMEHAILGFLTYKPLSGYGLKKFFDDSVGNFWSSTQSQIYRTLGRMEADGWVQQEVIPQEDRPTRKEYHLTDAGYAELMRWLDEPVKPAGQRHQWLLQIFFAHDLPDDAIRDLLLKRAAWLREAARDTRANVPAMVQRRADEIGSPRKRFLWNLTVDYAVAHLEWEIGWLEATAARLADIPAE